MKKHKILVRNIFHGRCDWGHGRGVCHSFSLATASSGNIRNLEISRALGYVWDTFMHEIVDWSQFWSPLFLFLITPSQFKWPQIQFSSQWVLSVILKCTRVGRNCSKICFDVAMETICLLSSWFSVALQYSFSCQMSIQETFQCQEKNRRERRKGLSTTSI